jgi:TorA maturation chaperone TorD
LASNPFVDFKVDSSWDLEQLKLEFHALFLVPADRYLFPYESCYRGFRDGRPGRLLGKPAREVRDYYQKARLKVRSKEAELPDHAGVEFSFLYMLANREVAAIEEGEEDRARHWHSLEVAFFDCHPARWIPDLCDEIKATANHCYFKGLAEWIEKTVEEIGHSLAISAIDQDVTEGLPAFQRTFLTL